VSAIIIRQGLVVGEHSSAVADVLIVAVGSLRSPRTIDAPTTPRARRARLLVGRLRGLARAPSRARTRSRRNDRDGARAGALGGYCALVAMPNTEPALDNVALVSYVLERGARTALDVAVAGAITKERRGESLAPMAEMAALGVRLFTDDGVGVQDPSVMHAPSRTPNPRCPSRPALRGRTVGRCGTMNEGALSGRLGLIGRPALPKS